MASLPALALLSAALWGASLLFIPWRESAPAHLGVFGGLFAVYLLAWRTARGTGSVRLILGAGLLFRALAFLSPPSLSDDIYRYAWDGRVQAAGVNPYVHPPDDPALASLRNGDHGLINHPRLRTIYPPLAQAAFRLAATVSPSITAQRALFSALEVLLLFLMATFLRRQGRGPGSLVLYAWNPLLIAEIHSSGHLDSLGILLLTVGVWASLEGRDRWAGVFWGLAFLSKFASVVLIPWMLIRPSGRRSLLPFLSVVALGAGAYAPTWNPAELHPLMNGGVAFARDWSFNAGLYPILLGLWPGSAGALRLALALACGGSAALLATAFKDRQVAAYAGTALAMTLAVSPVVHPWYALWLLPFLALYPSASGVLFTGLVALSYLVLPGFLATGVWRLPGWVPWVEYGLVYGVLLWELGRTRRAPLRRRPALREIRAAVLIPARNEERALPLVLAEIPRERTPWVIVADNGSTDRTADVARAAGARVASEPTPGYGRAVQAALKALPPEANVVVVLDADHSDHPEDLRRLLAPLEDGSADFVIGSRVAGGAPPGSLTPLQQLGNALACRVLRILFGQRFTDLGPFRALRRDLLEEMRMEDPTFGWNVEMQVKALRLGARVVEIPVRYRARIGRSKISGTLSGSLRAGARILWALAAYRLRPLAQSAGVELG